MGIRGGKYAGVGHVLTFRLGERLFVQEVPVRPPLDLNTVKNQDGLSSDGDVLPLASFFLPVFRVAADIFSVVTRSHQAGRLAPDQGLARFADEVFDRTATNGADGEPRKLSPTIRPRFPDRTRP